MTKPISTSIRQPPAINASSVVIWKLRVSRPWSATNGISSRFSSQMTSGAMNPPITVQYISIALR